jgi:phenylacetic acid degradation operon negative regulatory protein
MSCIDRLLFISCRLVKPRTEEFLYFMLWSADRLMRPSFRNLTDSYEAWIYRKGLQRQLVSLEKRLLVESKCVQSNQRLVRLTERGRIHAVGGRDPEVQWTRRWDGLWRIVLFDVPMAQNLRRDRLRKYLRARGFGFLQNSAWITPDPLRHESDLLLGLNADVSALIFLESRPCAGETDASIVASAWNFTEINRRYRSHLRILERAPDLSKPTLAAAEALRLWAAKERAAWLDAVRIDPFLPEVLLLPGYLGRRAWTRRSALFERAGKLLETFHPERYEKLT